MPEWFADVELVEEMLAKPVSQANIVEALHRANTAPGLNSEPFNGCGGTKAWACCQVMCSSLITWGLGKTAHAGSAVPHVVGQNVR